MTTILVIQHSAADSPGAAAEAIERGGHVIRTVRIDKGEPIPRSVETDVLMTFGGAMSLARDESPPWVAEEQRLIRDYIDRGHRVLGICLGSQMVAQALGAKVRRNREPEVGWHPIESLKPGSSALIDEVFPQSLNVLQWHQDTFDIPLGAIHLFRSAACDNQGYTIDERVFGFQFHLEANSRTVDIFLAASKLVKEQAPFIQSEAEIRRGKKTHLPTQTATLNRFLERFLA